MAEIGRKQTPEEEELEAKLDELKVLEGQLAQKELELVTYTAEIRVFEGDYLRKVGAKFAELDGISAEIAAILAAMDQADDAAREYAETARNQAERSARESGAAEDPGAREKFIPTKQLQELYRDLAKRVHPDLGVDDADRERRNRIMAEVNRAYSEGDAERLQRILKEWQASPDSIEGEGIGARLVRTIRMIALVKQRLARIEREMWLLTSSELAQLRAKVEMAKESGRDLFDEMVLDLDEQIELAKSRLEQLRAT